MLFLLTLRLQTLDCFSLRRLRLRVGFNQSSDGVGRLRASLDPVLCAFVVETNLAFLINRVISPDALDVRAIAF